MKGDFSKWYFGRKNNFNGVLHQQGRVLLDSDWNDQTRINIEWQDQAGQDIIGPGVAAVPVSEKDSFKVIEASIGTNKMKQKVSLGRLAANEVHLKIIPGRVWVDGLLVTLPGEESVEHIATYLEPPVQKSPAGNTRDLVVLEVWRDSINGFQMPNLLIESALGGPDTTERIHTAMAFRLLRLKDGDTCHNVADKLKDDFENKGKLTVSLKTPSPILWDCPKATSPTSGDCPLTDEGGYTGLEHDLYRIEIADVDDTSKPMFKWSQFNGGLVGTGTFELDSKSNKSIKIKDNLQAVVSSALDNSYLEIVRYDDQLGYWKVAYGARASLQNNVLLLEKPLFSDKTPDSDEKVFFRLWNGIEYIDLFSKDQAKGPKELKDGIQLEFDSPTATNYSPENFWTFSVRAGGNNNDTRNDPLIKEKPPEGIHYYRVPLAILKWGSNSDIYFDKGDISDCRKIFQPLANQNICCSFTVGDGKSSHGDYDSINEALAHLPSSGGEICLLPGSHAGSIKIENKNNIKIKGCDKKTKVSGKGPIFHIVDSIGIIIEHLDIEAKRGPAIVLEKSTILKRVGSPVLVNAGEMLRQHFDKLQQLGDEIRLNLSTSQPDTESDKISISAKPKEDVQGKVAAAEGLASNSISIKKKILQDIKITNNMIGAKTIAIYSSSGTGINIHNNIIGAIESAISIEDGDDIEIGNNVINASKNAIHVSGVLINIHNNRIRMADIEDADAAIVLMAGNSLIERNKIIVQYAVPTKKGEVRTFKAPGGIQITGRSERIKILENIINGGSGNGITLGSTIDLEKLSGLIDNSDEEKYKISPSGELLQGIVITKTEGPLNGITLSFVPISGSGNILNATTDENGKFTETAGESAYYVSVSTPGYKIETIEMTESPQVKQAPIYAITLIKAELSPDLEGVLSPIYEVLIERNEISNMGLCGIGSPLVTDPKFFSKSNISFDSVDLKKGLPTLLSTILLFGNSIISLNIHRNDIFNCLQKDFDKYMAKLTMKRGIGGISLGICENIVVQDNKIRSSGRSHIFPICGVFLASGKNVEVSNNHITDNGPIDEKSSSHFKPGIRGGLVLKQSPTLADIIAQPVSSRVGSKSSYDQSKNMLETSNIKNYENYNSIESMIKIHDNTVDQPVGKALFDVFSPVNIYNNFFNSGILITNSSSKNEVNMLVVKVDNNTISSSSSGFAIQIIDGHTIELLDNAIDSSGLGIINLTRARWVRVHSNCLNSSSKNPDSYVINVDRVEKVELLDNMINSSGLGGINISAMSVRIIANRITALSSNSKNYTIQIGGEYIELLNNTINSSGLGGINIISTSTVEDAARIKIHANSFNILSRPKFIEINSIGKVIFTNNSCDMHIYTENLRKKKLLKMVILRCALNITGTNIIFGSNQCSLFSPSELKSLSSVIDAHIILNSKTASVVGNRCQEDKIEENVPSIIAYKNSIILGNITTNKILPDQTNNLNLERLL